jgi:hypothetical protein
MRGSVDLVRGERGGERIELCSRSEALFPLFAYARLFLRMGMNAPPANMPCAAPNPFPFYSPRRV